MYSFSQNFEDVYIYRAFREVTEGFYIDAGAFDPVVDSITKMLYDLGWSGINLEPGPSFPNFSTRTRDINLPYALTSREGETLFHYNAADPATSTTTLSNLPEESSSVRSYSVSSTTLEAVVRNHAPGRHIHFLKLDIEGTEWEILKSTDWHTIRPELIIAESCLPYTNQRRDAGWSDHMQSYGYHEVFFDGINTYYLRDESLHRSDAFKFPVNVIDGVRKFDPYQHWNLAEDDGAGLVKGISEEVTRAIDNGNSVIREFIESNLGPDLRAQKDLVARLTSEQSEYFSRLRAIAKNLSDLVPDSNREQGGSRGGNSIEAVIEQVAQGIANLAEQRDRKAEDLIVAQEAAENAKEVLRGQERRVYEAQSEVRLLAKRLAIVRSSRFRMLELTEGVVGALKEAGEVPAPVTTTTTTDHHNIEPARTSTSTRESDSLAKRIARARAIPAWQRLIRFGNRALVRRADSYRDSGRFADAAEAYARSYALRPDRADLCLQMANMLSQLRLFDVAEDAYREALAKAPSEGLILLHFGHMLELSGRPAEALGAYLESAKLIPDNPDLALGLSRTKHYQYPGGEA